MAELSTIARPYAEAAFRLARELKDLPGWTDALARLSSVVSRPEALTEEQKNFVHLLAKNERLSVINEINSQFQVLLSTENGIVDAHVTSAYPLTEAQADDIRKTLEAKTGKKVKVTVSVDSDLIGGVAIRIGDEVTDLSVKGKLAQLQKALVA
jgi:F-type H+-transporting ATPase subunit delta